MMLQKITMYLADGFKAVQMILDYIETRESIFMSALLDKEKVAA